MVFSLSTALVITIIIIIIIIIMPLLTIVSGHMFSGCACVCESVLISVHPSVCEHGIS